MRMLLPCALLVAACSSDPAPPPRTEVAIAPPPPSAAAAPPANSATTSAAAPAAAAPPSEEASPDGEGTEAASGKGAGGGGRGEGIGLGNIGHGAGSGQGYGSGHGRLGGAHSATTRVQQGATTVNGRLPPEVIQRIVRSNFGRVKRCYADALAKKPGLTGRVYTKFVIDRTGHVASAESTQQSTIPDGAVVSCVVSMFRGLVFPQPEGGIVTVVYPLVFAPSDE